MASLWQAQAMLQAFAALKVPMIGYTRPKLMHFDDDRCEIRIPLARRTKNHLGSMYFGALSVGADVAAGWGAFNAIEAAKKEHGRRIDFVFKDVQGEFLRRPDGDVHFSSHAGKEARELVAKALATGERQNQPIEVIATVPSRSGDEPVARFTLTLSIKAR